MEGALISEASGQKHVLRLDFAARELAGVTCVQYWKSYGCAINSV
jgi:hypothetical protein